MGGPVAGTLDAVNALGVVYNPYLSPDGRVLVFAHAVGGVNIDLYLTSRAGADAVFAPPQPIIELNTPANDAIRLAVPDLRQLWFTRTGGTLTEPEWGIYYSSR